jgi:hypothetical protein
MCTKFIIILLLATSHTIKIQFCQTKYIFCLILLIYFNVLMYFKHNGISSIKTITHTIVFPLTKQKPYIRVSYHNALTGRAGRLTAHAHNNEC